MDRLRQPAMRVGGGVPRERPDDPALAEVGGQLLTRSWAITRLVVLVVLCGIGAAVPGQ